MSATPGMPLRILVSGIPGAGKTTLCSRVHKLIKDAGISSFRIDGFLCQEFRDGEGKRVGFDMVSIDGATSAPLARVDGPSTGIKVSKYHVQIRDFEAFALPILDRALRSANETRNGTGSQPRLLLFDEIGKMELFSREFEERMYRLLTSPNVNLYVLGTVALRGGGFIAKSKGLPGIEVVEINASTRDAQTAEIAQRLVATLSAALPPSDVVDSNVSSVGLAMATGGARGESPLEASSATLAKASSDSAAAEGARAGAIDGMANADSSGTLGGVSFDQPLLGEFSPVYVTNPPANFASLNAGDYMLYVGGASINRAFLTAMKDSGQKPERKYEALHQLLLARTAAAANNQGTLQWLRRGTMFPKPNKGAASGRCAYCGNLAEVWEVTGWQHNAGRPQCAGCWQWYEDWLLSDTTAFCGLVPRGELMAALLPVGLVSITVFREGRRPCGSNRNVAMVYAVGPNCGVRRKRGRRDVDDLSLEDFESVLKAIGGAIASAVLQYNAAASGVQSTEPRIDVLRVSLLSGGVYKHPGATKLQVATALIRGLTASDHGVEGRLPRLDFAFDDDVFRIAWRELGLEGA